MSALSTRFYQSEPLSSEKGLIEATAECISKRPATTAVMIYNTIDWLRLGGLVSAQNERANQLHFHATCFRNFHSGPFRVLARANDSSKAMKEVLRAPSTKSLTKCIRSYNSLIGPVYEIAELCTKIIFHIPYESIRTLSGIGGVSLTIWAGWNAVDNFFDLMKDQEDTLLHILYLAKHISYLAFGAIWASADCFNLVAPGICFTALVTSCLVLSTLVYYHENLWKGKEVNKFLAGDLPLYS